MATPSDEDLALAVQAGDRLSLGVLVGRWEQPLFRFAVRLLEKPDDARDVCQETFLRILRRSERFREGARFSTWMYQIALNLCRDQIRRRRRWRLIPLEGSDGGNDGGHASRDAVAPPDDDPCRALERQERRRVVSEALGALPPEQREVLVLKEYEGLKFREIAEILGCPESTVKSRMYNGLSALRGELGRRGLAEP